MLKIQRTTDCAAIVLTISGRLDAENVRELCESPYFTRDQVAELVHSYVATADANNPLMSPLRGRLSGLPPILIHVGDDEVLLDDSRRYVERAVAAGVDARLDIWMGMPHGFAVAVGTIKAAAKALDAVGLFLSERLKAGADDRVAEEP